MKNKIILLLLLTTVTFQIKGQHTSTIYFDKSWRVTKNKKEAEYYRIVNFDAANKPVGLVKDYYMNGVLQYEALKTYVDTILPRNDTTEGAAKWYSNKGVMTRESFYVNGKLHGDQKKWFDNGSLKSTGHYENGVLEGDFISYNGSGNYYYKIKYKHGVIENKRCEYYNSYSRKYDAFFDEFTLNEDPYGWILPDGDSMKSIIAKDTGMFVYNNSSKDAIAVVELPFSDKGYLSFGANIKKDSGEPKDAYGIVYDYTDENNYSYFLIRADGFFLTGRKDNGQETESTEWKKTKKLLGNNEYDKIYVTRLGAKMNFYLNDNKIFEGVHITFKGNKYGVICKKGHQSILLKSIYIHQT